MTCKKCGKRSINEYCFQHKPRKKLATIGKQGKKWQTTRRQWLRDNPGPYFCYLCGSLLLQSEVTLDHVTSRSRAPELRYEQSNLKSCCWSCNSQKSSLSVEQFKKMKGKQ